MVAKNSALYKELRQGKNKGGFSVYPFWYLSKYKLILVGFNKSNIAILALLFSGFFFLCPYTFGGNCTNAYVSGHGHVSGWHAG